MPRGGYAAQTTIWLLFAEDSLVTIERPLGDQEAEKIIWFWLV